MRTRHRLPMLAVFCAVAIGALAGCMNREAPLSPAPPTVRFSEAIAPVQLVHISRTYDSESEETTFLYQLQNTEEDLTTGGAQELTGILGVFTDVTVELPACAPALSDYFPVDGATIDTTVVGFNGITWGVGYDENPDYYYSITFPGDIPAGIVRGLVTTGGFTYVQNIVGPCAGAYQVAGTVFTDTDGDGTQGVNEFGIANVTVLLGGDGSQEVKTDSEGNFIFTTDDGSYTVSIPAATTASDYNETLFATMLSTTPLSVNATVNGADVTGIAFGWEPNIDAIIAGIDAGDYPTTGKSYKWWRKEFMRVLEGNANTAYTEAELLAFVQAIEDLAILDEYDFTPGQELQQIFAILNNHAFEEDNDVGIMALGTRGDNGRHGAYEYLVRELLTTELNHVSGRGLSDLQLQEILVGWGEGILNTNAPEVPAFTVQAPDGENFAIENPLEEGGKLFTRLNGATGGGGTGN